MSNANLKDIKLIEVQFIQNGGKRENIKINLNETMVRADALQVAAAIMVNPEVSTVRCYTTTGSFI